VRQCYEDVVWWLWGSLPSCTTIPRFRSINAQLKRRQARLLIAREFDNVIVKNKRDPVISESVVGVNVQRSINITTTE